MKKDEQLEFDTGSSSTSTFRKQPRPGASRVFAHINEETEWQPESSSNALSRMFIAVLALHVLVVVGILVHEMMKAKSASTVTAMALPSVQAPKDTAPVAPAPEPVATAGGNETPAMTDPAPPPAPVETEDYRFSRGDTLASVANFKKTTVGELRELNKLSPTEIVKSGTTIKVPKAKAATIVEATPGAATGTAPKDATAPKEGAKTHLVADGDTFTNLAKRYGTTVDQIQRLNPKINPKRMKKGMEIKLPK